MEGTEANPGRANSERVDDSVPISEILPIQKGGFSDADREQLAALVEAPLLEACEALHDKGVRTIYSSANVENIKYGGEAYVGVDFESLSSENKEIATSLGTFLPTLAGLQLPHVRIVFPIGDGSTVGDVRRASLEVASKFHSQ